ncbi:hypothetical protein DRH27_04360, partial [Candidatus Falkowbacteria bacterium]
DNIPLLATWQAGTPSYSLWITYTILSMAAIMLLPRQFHMAVIENSKERHIRTAMWLLPLYFVLITLFSLPIALAGIMQGYNTGLADFFILLLPLRNGLPFLSLLVFIGGFSAAVSMVIISTMTMTIMATNHLILPTINKFKKLLFLQKQILWIRWLTVVIILFIGYWFKLKLGGSYVLVKIGMISFAAALQFAPAMLGGLFWKKGNKTGALWGLSSGFMVWGYVSLLPTFIKSGWLSTSILTNGPFGISFLRPEQLFGISVFDPLSLTVFLSMFFNIGFYILGSSLFSSSREEEEIAVEFIDIFNKREQLSQAEELAENINSKTKIDIARSLFSSYLRKEKADGVVNNIIDKSGLKGKEKISILDLAKFSGRVEKELSGYIGSASAREAIGGKKLTTGPEANKLSEVYGKLVANLKISPQELSEKINYYQELEKLYKKQSVDLSDQVKVKTKELQKVLEDLKFDKIKLENQRVATLNILDDVSESQKELESTYRELRERSQELTALKSLSDELARALSVNEVVLILNAYLLNFLKFESIIYFILSPSQEGGFVYKNYLNKKQSEKYVQAVRADFYKYLADYKGKKYKQALNIVKNIKPKHLGKELDNSKKNQPSGYSYFPILTGEEKLGVIQAVFNKNQPIKPAEKELAQAFISAAALTIDRLETLFLAQNSKTTSLIESLTDGVLMYSNSEEVLLANPAFTRFTGLSEKKLKMASIYKLIEAVDIAAMARDAINRGKIFHLKEISLANRFYEVFITPVKDNKEIIVGGAIIFHDITSIKEIDRMKTEFVSVASHQLRTPLTAIKLFTDMLVSGEVGGINKEQADYLDKVRESTERMVRLVNDLLNVTRIESGRLSINPQLLSIKDFIMNIITEAKPLAESRKQKIIFNDKQPQLPKVPLDQNLMRQVVHNLTVNAIRYSPEKTGKIEVALSREDDDSFIISVKDNGMGIPAESHPKIFKKFYRADNATKAITEGTGLGLYVSKMIVKSSGGRIWFHSKKDKGSTFFVKLPLAGMKEKKGERGLAIS